MGSSIWRKAAPSTNRSSQGTGLWVRFRNHGDRALVVLLGDRLERDACFVGGKFVPWDEHLEAQGERRQTRVSQNVALFETKEVKIIDQSQTFFWDLDAAVGEEVVHRKAIEIVRNGAPRDMQTRYVFTVRHELTLAQQREFAALKQHNIPQVYAKASNGERGSSRSQPQPAAAATVTDVQAHEMIGQLRALPKEALVRFLQRFSLQRISELPASELGDARTFIEDLEAEYLTPQTPDDSIDPFT